MQALSDLLDSLFKAKHHPIVKTDEIYPLHFLDNLATARVIVLSETLRFNQVLDTGKLHDGLTRLIQHGDWKKLGGRIRMRSDGSLELHVPEKFTEQRPAVQFSQEVFDVAIEEHALGRQMPKATDTPSIQPGPTTFDHFSAIPNGPATLEDYLCSDHPVLRLHITSFTNSTVVALIWPHAIAGAFGVKEIFSAWSKVLLDEGELPALLGAREDVLDGIGTDADTHSPYALAPHEIKGWGFAKFAFRLMWTVVWRPTIDNRALCLPHQFMTQLRQTCLEELKIVHGENPPFLSEGDVLTAWAARFVAQTRGGERPGLLFNPLDITSRLNISGGSKGVYVQNMVCAMYTSVDANLLLRRPLGELAYAIRLSIQKMASDEQVRAQLRIFRSLGHTKSEPLYGDPGSQLVAFSNWTKFDLFNAVDFSPAVASNPIPISSSTPPGKPVYMHCQSLGENRFLRDCFAIAGKDLESNYWITAFLYPEDWTALEEYISQTWKRVR